MKSALIFFPLFVAAYACSCGPLPPFRQAVLDAKNSEAPFAVAVVISGPIPSPSKGKVIYNVLPEGCDKTVVVTTFQNPSLCGVSFKRKSKIVLRLNKDRSPTHITLCDSWKLYDSLSVPDKLFVVLNVPGRCDKCFKKCPRYTFCRKGGCIPIETCRALCPKGSICAYGGCIKKCSFTVCPPGSICYNGECGRDRA